MREICKSGSEGGASQANETSLPLSAIRLKSGGWFRRLPDDAGAQAAQRRC